jgi:hypothetical protein
MLLKDKSTGDLIRVDGLDELTSPLKDVIYGMVQSGEEEQDRSPFMKTQLLFPSGEGLPRCWTDASYRTGA